MRTLWDMLAPLARLVLPGRDDAASAAGGVADLAPAKPRRPRAKRPAGDSKPAAGGGGAAGGGDAAQPKLPFGREERFGRAEMKAPSTLTTKPNAAGPLPVRPAPASSPVTSTTPATVARPIGYELTPAMRAAPESLTPREVTAARPDRSKDAPGAKAASGGGQGAVRGAMSTPGATEAGAGGDPAPARESMVERYDRVAKLMLSKYGIRVRRWRKSSSGVAWEIRYADGHVARLIESPKPTGPISMAIFLHEVGHHAIGFNRYKPRCLEEYHAWQFSLAAMREHGLNVPPSLLRRVHRSLHYAIGKARRRGIKALPAELAPYLEKPPARTGQRAG